MGINAGVGSPPFTSAEMPHVGGNPIPGTEHLQAQQFHIHLTPQHLNNLTGYSDSVEQKLAGARRARRIADTAAGGHTSASIRLHAASAVMHAGGGGSPGMIDTTGSPIG